MVLRDQNVISLILPPTQVPRQVHLTSLWQQIHSVQMNFQKQVEKVPRISVQSINQSAQCILTKILPPIYVQCPFVRALTRSRKANLLPKNCLDQNEMAEILQSVFPHPSPSPFSVMYSGQNNEFSKDIFLNQMIQQQIFSLLFYVILQVLVQVFKTNRKSQYNRNAVFKNLKSCLREFLKRNSKRYLREFLKGTQD